MSSAIRLAILECDTPIDSVKAQHGTYGDCFQTLLQTSLQGQLWQGPSIKLDISKWDVVQSQYPRLEDVDAVLLTGSRHCSFSDDSWIVRLVEYVQSAYKAEKPIIGICFGHQVLGRALQAELGVNPQGWEVSVEKMELTATGKEIFGADFLRVQQMHRDIVTNVPPGFSNLAKTNRCEVQGLYKPKRVFSLQGHPEFNESIISKILEFRHQQKIFSDEVFEEAMTRVGLEHDAERMGVSMCKFLTDATST